MQEQIIPDKKIRQHSSFVYKVEKNGQKIKRTFEYDRLVFIQLVKLIVERFSKQNFTPSLRQIYYQIIGVDAMPNCIQAYNALGDIVKDMRLLGMIDWNQVEDRTRRFEQRYTEESIEGALERTFESYRLDLQEGQRTLLIVMSEKDAISQIVARACYPYSGVYHINRGYLSSDAMYKTYTRIVEHLNADPQNVAKIIYCGDHDPSGCQMTDDIYNRILTALCNGEQYDLPEDWDHFDRNSRRAMAVDTMKDRFHEIWDDSDYLEMIKLGLIEYDDEGYYEENYKPYKKRDYARYRITEAGIRWGDIEYRGRFEVVRAFLNRDQIEALELPPNPAKQTDSRFEEYKQKYGVEDSWELDALAPDFIIKTLRDLFEKYLDMELVEELREREKAERLKIKRLVEIEEAKIPTLADVAGFKAEILKLLSKMREIGGGIDLTNFLQEYIQEFKDKNDGQN